ncbi:hypothetical protein K450DRAFT_236989 [Umbelopsis ramanniana AG]|uniref:Ribosomal protein bL31m N-terminal domain-containing protein n=1 Tax=Umbelopsis ramanniana AG TaxID=1314678 RepID=A0AAD5EAN7_UMBRA|nr:uncharacterized protein K450DRAFT_236989 [Umbelopsis ramanniana AG]KAI8580431.1 hypothetical protein K450DRAFT_236989 [Umbelopsis ramanniana AG]
MGACGGSDSSDQRIGWLCKSDNVTPLHRNLQFEFFHVFHSPFTMLMAQRISLVARRQPATILARYASGQAVVPEQFTQTIVLSNGATYTVRTTSPKPQVRLTKDTRNHPLWNPSMLREGVNDESEQLTKFQKRFGDLGYAKGSSKRRSTIQSSQGKGKEKVNRSLLMRRSHV